MLKHLGITYLEITFKDGNGLHGITLEIVGNREAIIKGVKFILTDASAGDFYYGDNP